MLSDEERKAIEIVKGITEDDLLNYWEGPEEPYNAIQTVLNIIEKQSKKIEELKEKNKKYTIHFTDKQYSDAIKLAQSVAISMFEGKIKAIIKELDYGDYSNFERRCKQEVLQSLLEKE